ncbi:MAG: tyrosine-type recombinase/integrase [Salinibacterium sp.]|nr:tyrosine-type recombinase/integrase [Salinibacterium sp.]
MFRFVVHGRLTADQWFEVVADRGDPHTFACAWLRYLVDCGSSPNTVLAYGRRVAGYLSWCQWQSVAWDQSRLRDLVRWKGDLARERIGSRPPRSEATVAAWTTSAVMFLRWAHDHADCSGIDVGSLLVDQQVPAGVFSNQVGYARRVVAPELRTARRQHTRAEWIGDADQRDRLRELELNARDRFLVDLLDLTALRCGEALNLFRGDLHLLPRNEPMGCWIPGPHLHVRQNLNGNGARTKTGERWVPVGVDLVESYGRYREDRQRLLGTDSDPHVFVNLYGKAVAQPLRYDTVIALFRRVSRELGIRVRPHMLRHTRATIWARGLEGAKVDLDVLKELLGHASLESTGIYTHVSAEDLRDIVRRASLRGGEVLS